MEDLNVRCEESKPMLEPGVYRAKLISIEKDHRQKGSSSYVQFKWSFKILKSTNPKEMVDLTGVTPTTMTPNSKLFIWVAALNNGVKPIIGQDLSLASLIGKQCRVLIKLDQRGDKQWSQIVELYSPEGATPAPAQQPPPQPIIPPKADPAKLDDDFGGDSQPVGGGGKPESIDDEFSDI